MNHTFNHILRISKKDLEKLLAIAAVSVNGHVHARIVPLEQSEDDLIYGILEEKL